MKKGTVFNNETEILITLGKKKRETKLIFKIDMQFKLTVNMGEAGTGDCFLI